MLSEKKEFQIEKTNALAKYESAIRKFLKEQIGKNDYGLEFDISDSKMNDMQSISLNDFKITKFSLSPRAEDKNPNFHFYVGRTEFHITGKAADRIRELLD